MFFLPQVAPPIKGISKVGKINISKFWIQCAPGGQFFALKQFFCLHPIGVPTDICIDQEDDALFWIDIELRRLERSNLDGGNRLGLVSGDNFGPKNDKFSLGLVTVHGEYVYWGLRSSESINRINKRTGLDSKIIKSNAMHLSSLISVNAVSYVNNPCKGI